MRTAPRSPLRFALIAALGLSLAACGRDEPAAPSADAADGAPKTALGRTVANAMDEARAELRKENLSLGENTRIHIAGVTFGDGAGKDGPKLPKAEVTPTGGLLVEGKPVALDASQQALLLAYRNELLAVIDTGMALGAQGADLGMMAAAEALKGVFSGGPGKEFEQRMEAEGEKIKAEAAKMCRRLPALLDAQQAAAAAIPEFVPYARMVQADIDECLADTEKALADTGGNAERARIRDEVRAGIRDAIRGGTRQADEAAPPADDAAAEAEAASAAN